MRKSEIVRLLKRLGEEAAEEGIILEISIYGGSAMLLAYNGRAATKDVDAVLVPRELGDRLVLRIAEEEGLPNDWINQYVVQFLSPVGEAKRRLAWLEEETGLIVHVPTARYLLAMKALACRRPIGGYEGDVEDLRFLVKKLGLRSVDEIQQAVDQFYPDDVIPPEDRLFLESLLEESE